MLEIGIQGGEIVAPGQHVQELAAHLDQRAGAVGGEIEPAQQLLPPRLGRLVKLGGGRIGGHVLPRLDGGVDPGTVGAEFCGKRLEECDPGSDGEIGVAGEDFPRQGDARRLAAVRQQLLAQIDQAFAGFRGQAAPLPGAVDQRPPPLRDRLQQLAEERCVHLTGPSPRPPTRSRYPGIYIGRSRQKSSTPTKGITPQITSRNGMSGAMLLITKIFKPTGG